MDLNDILTLARAGFTAAQITALGGQSQQDPQPQQLPQLDQIMQQLQQLQQAVQTANVGGARQPAPAPQPTGGDVLARIINPTYKPNN